MSAEDRAGREEQLADLQEATEQRMHAFADLLPDGYQVHQRASAFTARAVEHQRRARGLRATSD